MTQILIGKTRDEQNVTLNIETLIESRMLIQAQSGGGKTTLLRRIAEQAHRHVQQIIIDPEGEFHTLRPTFDYILCGKGGDAAADPAPARAKLLARRLLELGVSAVCDLSELKAQPGNHERNRFVRHFLTALLEAPASHGDALIIIDEAHLFCPQDAKGEAAEAVIDIATRGRKRGLSAILATQRLSKLHKDAAAELRNVLIGMTGLDIDQQRAGDVLGMSKADRLKLRDLKWSEFYAYGPAFNHQGVNLIHVAKPQTESPKRGRDRVPPAAPSEKIRAMLAKVADIPAEADAELRTEQDLRKALADTRRELAQARKAQAPSACNHERDFEKLAQAHRKDVERLEAIIDRDERAIAEYEMRMAGAHAAAKTLIDALGKTSPAITPYTPPKVSPIEIAARTLGGGFTSASNATRTAATPTRSTNGNHPPAEGVTAPQQRILDALATFAALGLDSVHKSVVAVFADQSPSSSGYANNLGALRNQRGLIEYPSGGFVALTDAGRAVAVPGDPIRSVDELHERWYALLPNPQARIIEQIVAVYPESVDRAQLAERAEQSPTSSGYANNLGRLRSLGLLDYPTGGRVVATSLLFPEGMT